MKRRRWRAGKTAQSAKCLLYKHEDLEFSHQKMWVWWYAIPVLGSGARQVSETHWPTSLAYLTSSKPVKDLILKKKDKAGPRGGGGMFILSQARSTGL